MTWLDDLDQYVNVNTKISLN